jgi:hypothetical protein
MLKPGPSCCTVICRGPGALEAVAPSCAGRTTWPLPPQRLHVFVWPSLAPEPRHLLQMTLRFTLILRWAPLRGRRQRDKQTVSTATAARPTHR